MFRRDDSLRQLLCRLPFPTRLIRPTERSRSRTSRLSPLAKRRSQLADDHRDSGLASTSTSPTDRQAAPAPAVPAVTSPCSPSISYFPMRFLRHLQPHTRGRRPSHHDTRLPLPSRRSRKGSGRAQIFHRRRPTRRSPHEHAALAGQLARARSSATPLPNGPHRGCTSQPRRLRRPRVTAKRRGRRLPPKRLPSRSCFRLDLSRNRLKLRSRRDRRHQSSTSLRLHYRTTRARYSRRILRAR